MGDEHLTYNKPVFYKFDLLDDNHTLVAPTHKLPSRWVRFWMWFLFGTRWYNHW